MPYALSPRARPRLALAAIALLLAAAPFVRAAAPNGAQPPAKPPAPQPLPAAQLEFVISNTIFALLHEFGHVIIRDFGVPLLGMEEDSADTLAALIMLGGASQSASPENTAKLTRALALAAVGNALTWQSGVEQQDTEILFWDQHGLSVRRASRIACLIYGSNPKQYAWIADSAKMPDRRRDGCEDEFALAHHAGAWVLDTYGNRGHKTHEGATPQVTVTYGPARGPALESIRSALQQRGFLEALAHQVDSAFAFQEPLVVRVSTCGTSNAYWDQDHRELQLCYELPEAFLTLSHDPAVAKAYDTVSKAGGMN